jgi:uncharacterized integral membrane protein
MRRCERLRPIRREDPMRSTVAARHGNVETEPKPLNIRGWSAVEECAMTNPVDGPNEPTTAWAGRSEEFAGESAESDPPTFPPPAFSAAEPPHRTHQRGVDDRGRVKSSKVSGIWIGLISTALFLILLIIFIAQNSRQITLHLFGWAGHFNLSLTILIAVVLGALLVAVPGSIRIVQLRRSLRANAKASK